SRSGISRAGEKLKAEANVYALIESEDQANAVVDQIEDALNQLSFIDEWLGYYTELLDVRGRMGQDVHQVEVRNKTMQIASANQKNLLSELSQILTALKLPGYVAETLRNEPLEDPDGIANCERAVEDLMSVLARKFDSTLSEMSVVSERMQLYNGYARQFATRLCDYLVSVISVQAEFLIQDKSRVGKKGIPRIGGHEQLETKMFKYRKLIKLMKEIDTRKHFELEMNYVKDLGRVYRKSVRDFVDYIKQNVTNRKVDPEDLEQYSSTALSAIGSKAIGNIISGEKGSALGEKKKGKLDNLKALYRRKSTRETSSRIDEDEDTASFIARSGHSRKGSNLDAKKVGGSTNSLELSSEEKMSPDEVKTDDANTPVSRSVELWQESLSNSREKLKDLKINNRLHDIQEDLIALMESGLKYDQTFVVGMMARTEECKIDYESTAYQYVVHYLDGLSNRLAGLFDRFILFVDRLESFIVQGEGFTRTTVSKAYERMVKIIFETLEAVAKDAVSDQKDAKEKLDDKEQLNIHILTIENMHHFYNEVRARKVAGLEQFVKAAKVLYDLNLNAYVKTVIRRPFGKLLEFFEGVEDLLNTLAPEEVSFHLQYSKSALKDVIKKTPGKEV
ncbi:hypothetical protein HDU96_009117, partial [Phlyctochytrium bullatum]